MTPSRILRPAAAGLAAASLVMGLTGGLARLGISPSPASAMEFHGALMIAGFFGTLIGLERAVADGRSAALMVPLLSLAGVVSLVTGFEQAAAAGFLLAGLGLTLLTGLACWRQPTLFAAVMTMGAAFFVWANALWLSGRTITDVTYIWLGFLILTIAGERIELSRLMATSDLAKLVITGIIALFTMALAGGEPWSGSWLFGASLAALATWLLVHDIARKTVRTRGLARYSAFCLLAGYVWLLVAALGVVAAPPGVAAFGHDAAVHAIGLGFVLSMVFAHAPIILPAVAGATVRYTPLLYLPTALIQAAVALRVGADLSGRFDILPVAAWATIVAILLYGALLAMTALVGKTDEGPDAGAAGEAKPGSARIGQPARGAQSNASPERGIR
ncbi:hypothetical protein [Aurantimonas sp. VKM B-3413]|uniref:hypothetical protein n=1 Tax=Aurantimonas sp. VKM B-3413 TaxID=2779401 RepID=UPI001E4B8674|nr:hypothetical protein [Aurantimonas sp. VKM B-3413]MCB8836778.1 hypothetical protein [Aurantimonas sp. VKM B-3413]